MFADLRATITSFKVKWGLDQGTAPDTYELDDDMEDPYSQARPEPDTDPKVEHILNAVTHEPDSSAQGEH
ncbi:hypothetical protein PI124_g12543 [Phytophthora idaei]|nr:hypothetical protein PI125_g12078 [Phytophthora idaei]KAG3242620.1 hypothetical protein PI124_g12543 [Phytophthora idaei]